MVLLSSNNGDFGYKRMLSQDSSSEVVPFLAIPVPYNMQPYGPQPPCGVQYYPPPPFVYSEGGGPSMLQSDSGPRLQWQEPGFVSGHGNYMPQQSGGQTGGVAPVRLGIQPPPQGPPPTQPTPTSTPPGADMKSNNHMPSQSQLQQGNIELGQMYVQNPPSRPSAVNQNFHGPFPSRIQGSRIRSTQVLPTSGVANMYPMQFSHSMMPPIQQVLMSMPPYNPTMYPQNQRHQGQTSNHSYFPSSIMIGPPASQPYFGGTNYYPPAMVRQSYVSSTPGSGGPAPQAGAPQGPIPAMTNVPTGMTQMPAQSVSSQESKKNRPHAIPIIDPNTGINILSDQSTFGNNNNITPPRSHDSSARETPQPEMDKNVAQEFAEKVAFAVSNSSSEVNGPFVEECISSDNDSLHKQSVPNSEINVAKVIHQLQTNVQNFVPKAQLMQQQQQQQQQQLTIQQPDPSQVQHTQLMPEPVSLPVVQNKEEIRQSSATPIVSAVTNSPAVEIHWGERPHKEFSNVNKSAQSTVPGSIAQSPNRAPVRKQKTSESERQNSQPMSSTPVVAEPQLPVVAPEPVQAAKKGQKTGKEEANVLPQPKERREKSRSVLKEQSPPAPTEPTVSPTQALPAPVVPAKSQSQFLNMASIKGFTSSNIIPAAPEEVPVPVKQQANGETHASGDVIDPGNKASQKPKKNKGSKMRVDLNRKGIEKEGTDMDAFTEPAITVADDREHAASSPPASPAVSIKSATAAQVSPPPENKIKDDLEEREEKLVAARNEENAKVSALNIEEGEQENNSQVIEKPTQVPLKFKYKDGQWSPQNPEGKRKYERDFLMELKNEPQSRKKPENFPDWEVILKDTSNRQPRGGGGGVQNNMFNMRHDMIAPMFLYNKSSNSQRGPLPKRGSQQGKIKGSKPNVIHMSLSLHEDVKLRESENAWKPKVRNLGGSDNISQEQKESEELYKKVRGILNKLTPQKFDKLMFQVKNLPINTVERLEKVIDLVFEKAVDEPGFSKFYAHMCKLLSELEVSYQNEEGKDIKCNFRKLIITRCQSEFESEKHAELDVEKRLEEIRNCADPEKKKELQLTFEEDERRVRMKSVGNVRFIGELFKLGMLTSGIMFRCLTSMLKKPEEESLECLCKLLTTIGKDLEVSKDAAQLNPIFNHMSLLSQKQENSKVSSRVRFMLQDVIDLRKNKWIPRRDENNPKTIDQITKEAEKETLEMNIALSQPRKNYDSHQDDRRGGRGRNTNNQSEDGWTVSIGKNSYRNNNVFDQNKLQSMRKDLDSEISLGGSSFSRHFSNFGSNAKTSDKPHILPTNNMYSALRNEEKKPPPSNMMMNKPPNRVTPSPSIEKERMQYPGHTPSYDGRLSRGSSLQRDRPTQSPQPQSRDNSVPRQTQQTTSVSSSKPVDKPETIEDIKRCTKSIIDEYLSEKDVKDCKLNVLEKFTHSTITSFIQEAFEMGLDVRSPARKLIGQLMAELLSAGVALLEHMIQALSVLIESGDDVSIDVPKFWEYLAEIIVPILYKERLTFADVRTAASSVLKNPVIGKLLIPTFNLLVQEGGPAFVQKCFASSNVSLEDFLPPGSVEKFVKENNLEYLTGGNCYVSSSSTLSLEEVEMKLIDLIKNESASFETIKNWIFANIGEKKSKDASFIRTLVTAVVQASLKSTATSRSLNEKIFKDYGKLIHAYVDNSEELELASLNAIQALITKLEHPQGLLLHIFNTLWEDGILSNESFLKWRDGEEVEGKGVSVVSLASFFVALQDAETDDETS